MHLHVIFIAVWLAMPASYYPSDTASISGRIVDGNGPIIQANVALRGTSRGDITDENGRFEIGQLRSGVYTSSGGQNQIIYRNAESRSVSRGISLCITQNFDFPLTFSLGGTLQDVFVTEPNGSKRDSVKNLFNYTQTDPIIDAQNPFGDTFDTSYVYGPILGRRIMVGIRSRSIRSSQDW